MQQSAMASIRAAIYLRISMDRTGEELAVSRQLEDCQAIAEARGWQVADVYTDNSVSASKRSVRRPQYERMVEDFKLGKFNALVCYDLDRLTRQPRQLEDWIEAAEDRGLLLVTANGEADLTTDGGRMFARIKASVARAEVERKSARQIRAAQQRADRGKAPGGPRLFGFDAVGIPDPVEAPIVERLFSLFAAGESLKGLSAAYSLSPSTIRTMLTNPRYAGRAVRSLRTGTAPSGRTQYRRVTTGKPGEWKPLVSEALYDAVQARLNDPRRITNREGTNRKHLGSGLYLCGICGNRVRTNGARYWCPRGGHITRSQAPVDTFVQAVVRARLSQPDVAQLLSKTDDGALQSSDREATKLRARLLTIEADYDAGHIDGARFSVASQKVLAELKRIEGERARALLGGVAGNLLASADPATAFDTATLNAKRALIEALVTVRLLPSPRGSKVFNPESVTIEWARGSVSSTTRPESPNSGKIRT